MCFFYVKQEIKEITLHSNGSYLKTALGRKI